MSHCHLDKYFYNVQQADNEYRQDLSDFREGINLTTNQRKDLAAVLKSLLDKGHSIYQIKATHPEIKQSIKCLYNYIESDVFKENGIALFSLKEKLQRKIPKTKEA